MSNPKYSLWTIHYRSVEYVELKKEKDTNSLSEVSKWMKRSMLNNTASFYTEEDTLNADYVQTFSEADFIK
jgi:hypothetical protein